MKLAVLIAVIALVALANVTALILGRGRTTRIHLCAMAFGALGLFCLLGLLIALADAFTQIWVKRLGYEGLPILVFFWATVAATAGSLATSAAVVMGKRPKAAR